MYSLCARRRNETRVTKRTPLNQKKYLFWLFVFEKFALFPWKILFSVLLFTTPLPLALNALQDLLFPYPAACRAHPSKEKEWFERIKALVIGWKIEIHYDTASGVWSWSSFSSLSSSSLFFFVADRSNKPNWTSDVENEKGPRSWQVAMISVSLVPIAFFVIDDRSI